MWTAIPTFTPGNVLAASELTVLGDDLQHLYSFMPLYADGRLTLSSGNAAPATDITAATTLYYTPTPLGTRIALYDGSSAWTMNVFSETSLSLSGLIKWVMYDIFGYLSGGTFTLEAVAWKKVTATNSPTSGASKVINLSDTTTLAIGMEVTVKDGSNSEVATITAVVSNTSITVANLANSYTLPDVYGYAARATALTTQNGIDVKNGSTTKRYLGTIKITATTGQCEDSKQLRHVWNAYNRVGRVLQANEPTDSWNYTTAAWRSANANTTYGVGRVSIVIGKHIEPLKIEINGASVNSASNVFSGVGVGLNQTDTNVGQTGGGQGTNYSQHWSLYKAVPPLGSSYIQKLEWSAAAGTTTWYGDAGVPTFVFTGILGEVMA